MLLFEVELFYTNLYKPDNKYLLEHQRFLDNLRVDKGLIVQVKWLRGVKEVIEFKSKSQDIKEGSEQIEQIIKADPYVVRGLVTYKINCYTITSCSTELISSEERDTIYFKFVLNLLTRLLPEVLPEDESNPQPTSVTKVSRVGREYLLKLSALISQKMYGMMMSSCYVNCINATYLGSEAYRQDKASAKKALETTVANVCSLITKYQTVTNHTAPANRTIEIEAGIKKTLDETILKIQQLPGYIRFQSEAITKLLSMNSALSGAFASFPPAIELPSAVYDKISEYLDYFDINTLNENLTTSSAVIQTEWDLLQTYDEALSKPNSQKFSDLNLIIRDSANVRSEEDLADNPLLDFTPGNRCIDPIMQYSINAVKYYYTTFCRTSIEVKEADEFCNLFMQADTHIVNAKRNLKGSVRRIIDHIYYDKEDSLTMYDLLTTVRDVVNIAFTSLALFKEWTLSEKTKLKAGASTQHSTLHQHFNYSSKSVGSLLHRRRRSSNAQLPSSVANSAMPPITANATATAATTVKSTTIAVMTVPTPATAANATAAATTSALIATATPMRGALKIVVSVDDPVYQITKIFEDTVCFIDHFIELHKKFFAILDLAQNLAKTSPLILAKINELFYLDHQLYLVKDDNLLKILSSAKPIETMDRLKKEVAEKLLSRKGQVQSRESDPDSGSVTAKALTWLQSRFSTSASNTPVPKATAYEKEKGSARLAPGTPLRGRMPSPASTTRNLTGGIKK